MHIGAGDLVVELHTIEQRRLSVEQDDITQVQIAVALAYVTRLAPGIQQRGLLVQLASRAGDHTSARRLVEPPGPELYEP